MKGCEASGPTVETQYVFGLGSTGPRLLAQRGPFKAPARTGPSLETRLLFTFRMSCQEIAWHSVLSFDLAICLRPVWCDASVLNCIERQKLFEFSSCELCGVVRNNCL